MGFYESLHEEDSDAPEVLYMRRTGPYGAGNHALMETFKAWLKGHQLYGDDTVIMAIPLDNPCTTVAQECRYDVCVARAPGQVPAPSEGAGIRRLDVGRYAVFLIEHTVRAIQEAWAACFSELKRLGYSPDFTRPVMERYAKRLVEQHRCELCVPILDTSSV